MHLYTLNITNSNGMSPCDCSITEATNVALPICGNVSNKKHITR